MGGERESGKSMLLVQLDDDDTYKYSKGQLKRSEADLDTLMECY